MNKRKFGIALGLVTAAMLLIASAPRDVLRNGIVYGDVEAQKNNVSNAGAIGLNPVVFPVGASNNLVASYAIPSPGSLWQISGSYTNAAGTNLVSQFTAMKAGQIVFLQNVGTNNIALVHSAGKIDSGTSATIVIAPSQMVVGIAKNTTNLWVNTP